MRIYIISPESIISKSIKDKVSKKLPDCDFEVFQTMEDFQSYYIKALEKTKHEEIVILDMVTSKLDISSFENFARERELPFLLQKDSWTEFLKELNLLADTLILKLEELSKNQEEKEKKLITEPLHIYHKPEKEIIREVVTVEVPVQVPTYITVPEENKKKFGFFSRGNKTPILGVVSASSGSGATSFCVNYAAYMHSKGVKVLLIDRSDNMHLSKIEIKGQEIKKCPLYEVTIPNYDCIIIDFGTIAEITTDGKVIPFGSMHNEKRMERQYCNEIILTVSSLPWRLFEIKACLSNIIFEKLASDWIFYITGEENKTFDAFYKVYKKQRVFIKACKSEEDYEELNKIIESRSDIK